MTLSNETRFSDAKLDELESESRCKEGDSVARRKGEDHNGGCLSVSDQPNQVFKQPTGMHHGC